MWWVGYVRGSRGWRVLRPPARGVLSLREHLSPTGQPFAACGVAEPDGTAPRRIARASASTDATASKPHLHAVPSRGSPPSSRAAPLASAASTTLARSRAGLLSAVYHQSRRQCRPTSHQMKLQRWCVASVVVIRSRWLKQWLR
jgi:hypothetical protein